MFNLLKTLTLTHHPTESGLLWFDTSDHSAHITTPSMPDTPRQHFIMWFDTSDHLLKLGGLLAMLYPNTLMCLSVVLDHLCLLPAAHLDGQTVLQLVLAGVRYQTDRRRKIITHINSIVDKYKTEMSAVSIDSLVYPSLFTSVC